MSAVKSILLAIDVATRRRDLLGKKMVEIQQTQLFAQDQMVQLQTYAADTDARWTSAAQICATPELMRHHYQFMDRLHHAIGMQSGVISDLSLQVEMAKKTWLEAEFRLSSLKQVLKRKQMESSAVQSRREQKQMDEFAALQFRRTAAGNPIGELT
jgi:flagellar FliJ protein